MYWNAAASMARWSRRARCGVAGRRAPALKSSGGIDRGVHETRGRSGAFAGWEEFRRAERQVGAGRDRDFPLGRMMSERRWRVTGRGRGLFAIEVDDGGGFRPATTVEVDAALRQRELLGAAEYPVQHVDAAERTGDDVDVG